MLEDFLFEAPYNSSTSSESPNLTFSTSNQGSLLYLNTRSLTQPFIPISASVHEWATGRWCLCFSLELEPVGRAARLVVLQVDGAPAGRGGEVDPVLRQGLLVLGHPVAQGVGVIGGDDGHLCNMGTKLCDFGLQFVVS